MKNKYKKHANIFLFLNLSKPLHKLGIVTSCKSSPSKQIPIQVSVCFSHQKFLGPGVFWCLDFFRFLNIYICGMRYQGSVPSLNMKFISIFTDTLYTKTKGKRIQFKSNSIDKTRLCSVPVFGV